MKLFSILSLPFIFFTTIHAQESDQPADPQGFDPLGQNAVQINTPAYVLFEIEFIELTLAQLSELTYGAGLLKSNDTLRKEVQELITNDKAKVAQSALISARPGELCRLESSTSFIYPTEYDPAEVPDVKVSGSAVVKEVEATGPTPTAFEERPVGFTIEMSAKLGAGDPSYISIDLECDWLSYEGTIDWTTWTDKRGTANISMPKFYNNSIKTSATLRSGKYELLATLSPKNEKSEMDPNKKYIVFVRAIRKQVGR